jgi:hypothetical protein
MARNGVMATSAALLFFLSIVATASATFFVSNASVVVTSTISGRK